MLPHVQIQDAERSWPLNFWTRSLLHQQDRTAALDLARNLAVHVGRHAGNTARQDLSALGDKFAEQIRVLVIDRLGRNIDATAGHGAVGAAESGTAFGGFRLHPI
jgi:hypothetical protein